MAIRARNISLILAAAVASLSFCFAFPSSANADVFQTDPSAVWNLLLGPDESWAGTELSGPEQQAIADTICGVAGVECIGAIALVSGGTIAIDAVWQSGLGSAFGSWVANLDSSTTNTNITGEVLCPFVYQTWGGTTQTYGVPTCNIGGVNLGSSNGATGTIPVISDGQIPTFNGMILGFAGTNCGFSGGAAQSTTLLVDPSLATGGSSTARACETQMLGMEHAFPKMTETTIPNSACMEPYVGGVCQGGFTCQAQADSLLTGATGYTGTCHQFYMKEEDLVQALGGTFLRPCGASGQVTCPSSPKVRLGAATGVGGGGTTSPNQTALHKMSATGATGASPEIQCAISATTCAPDTQVLQLPRPLISETYDQYIARLRQLGMWGTITEVDDDMDYPAGSGALQLNPGEVTEVQINTTTTGIPIVIPNYWAIPGHGLSSQAENSDPTQQGRRAPWAPPGVALKTITSITIRKVPATYTGGGCVGALCGGPGNGPCNCPAINFNPLRGINYGSTFPFGVFGVLGGTGSVFNSFTGSGSGRPVTFALPLGSSSQTVTLSSSSWETTYRPIVFPIIEFGLTLLAVLWFSLRVIGHPGGDTGENE